MKTPLQKAISLGMKAHHITRKRNNLIESLADLNASFADAIRDFKKYNSESEHIKELQGAKAMVSDWIMRLKEMKTIKEHIKHEK